MWRLILCVASLAMFVGSGEPGGVEIKSMAGFGNERISLSICLDDGNSGPKPEIDCILVGQLLRLKAIASGIESEETAHIGIYCDDVLIASGTENPFVIAEFGPLEIGKHYFYAQVTPSRGSGESLETGDTVRSTTRRVTVATVIVEADIIDELASGSEFASGVNPESVLMTLNGIEVTPSLTEIESGYRVRYGPATTELSSGTNQVSIRARDLANAGTPEGEDPNANGNETDPDPFTWSFSHP